jgi:hypothetical protein
MRRCGVGNTEGLHLGHLASSFGIDATPLQIQESLHAKRLAKEEVALGEKTARGAHGRVHVEQRRDGQGYHSSLVQKAAQRARDRRESTKRRPSDAIGEFDAE